MKINILLAALLLSNIGYAAQSQSLPLNPGVHLLSHEEHDHVKLPSDYKKKQMKAQNLKLQPS